VIGIALRLYDPLVISEFFELFKTPWEFFKPNKIYEVIITDEFQFDYHKAKLIIVFHRDVDSIQDKSQRKIYHQPVLLCCNGANFPIYIGTKEIKGSFPMIHNAKTGEAIGGYYYKNGKIVLHIGYDFFEESGYLICNGQPPEYAYFPTLDIHIDNLRNWILQAGAQLVEIPPMANGSKFFACLTHDVDFSGIRNYRFDHTFAGFLYRALVISFIQYLKGKYSLKMLARNWVAVAKLPFIHLGLIEDFWVTFKQYREIEREAASTFFFVPFKNRSGKSEKGTAPIIRAVKYDIAQLKPDIAQLIEEGCEIAVHGIDSWIDVEKGREELGKICALTRQSECGVRMHWLYFEVESPKKLEQAGYIFDSTSGYNEIIGYKTGTSQVYKPLGVNYLLELPMHVMDTALFYPDRMNLTFSEGIKTIRMLIKIAASNGGVLTFNWHDRSIAPERLWDDIYRYVLEELKIQGAYFLTAGAVVNWFRKRRAILFVQTPSNGLPNKVKLTGPDISPVDRMFLRMYFPCEQRSPQKFHKPAILNYQDVLLDGQNEVEIPSTIHNLN